MRRWAAGFWIIMVLSLGQFTLVAQEHSSPVAALHQQWRVAQSKVNAGKDASKLDPVNNEFARRFLDLAMASSGNTKAVALVYTVYADIEGEMGREALEELAAHHADGPEVQLLLGSFPLPTNSAAETLFRTVAEKHSDPKAKATALFILAEMLKDQQPAEADALFNRLLKEFREVRLPDGEVQRLAEKGLQFTKTLSIGRTAPETTGIDVTGKRFALSDYRGKVVLMTFGGEWCAPCRAFRKTERLLVTELAGKEFAVVNIAADSKETLLKVMQNEDIPWRVVIDEHRHGPIALQWQIRGWPNIYLIDQTGTIREHWLNPPEKRFIKEKVDRLLANGTRR